jgi:DNA-binding GntR family transcriptional regulator
MSIPHIGWPVAGDDDEPSGRSGMQGGRGMPAPGRVNAVSSERGARGSIRLGEPAGRKTPIAGPAVSVLADRLAAALIHHEPGWRLPRHSALARRYNVSTTEIDAAIEELVSRHLVRRLADGQVYRASPAEYVISLEGLPGLTSFVDAMGGELACRSRQIAWRLPPEDISWALRMSSDQQVCVVRYLWTAGGEPAALSTTYVPGGIGRRPEQATTAPLPTSLNLVPLAGLTDDTAQDAARGAGPLPPASAAALYIEFQAPPPSVARSLRLSAGQPAMIVTIRFDEPDSGQPVALTIAVLRPDTFRVVVQTPSPPLVEGSAGTMSGSWTHALEDLES